MCPDRVIVPRDSKPPGRTLTNLVVQPAVCASEESLPPYLAQIRMGLIEYAVSHTTEETTVRAIDDACRLAGCSIGFFQIVDPATDRLLPPRWSTAAEERLRHAASRGERLVILRTIGWADAVRQRKAALCVDFEMAPGSAPACCDEVLTELITPVLRLDQVVAVMGVGSHDHVYTEQDVRFVSFVADVAWQIILNKKAERDREQALAEARRMTDQLTALLEGAKRTLRTTDPRATARELFDASLRLTQAQAGFVALQEPEQDQCHTLFAEPGDEVYTAATRPLTGLAGEVMRSARSVIDNDFTSRAWELTLPPGHPPLTNILVAPLVAQGRTMGVICVGNRPDGFTEDDQRIAEGFADLLALTLLRHKQAEEVRSYEDKLRKMTLDSARTEEQERRRIALDLHDRIGQSLALAQIKLSGARASVEGEERSAVDEARELVAQSLADTRSLTFELSPPVLYDLEVKDAMSWLVEDIERRYGIHVALQDDGKPIRLDEATAGVLFRAVRELLVNVFKHARTKTATVSLHSSRGELHVTVEDEGQGFETPDAGPPSSRSGFGLFSIEEQVRQVGGSIELLSIHGKGTCVRLQVPLPQPRRPEEAETGSTPDPTRATGREGE